jgi:hypothetical protein
MQQAIDLADMPMFDRSEASLFHEFTGERNLASFGKLALVIDNSHRCGARLEQIVSLYLITNVILMSQASRKIVKSITLTDDTEAIDTLFPALNALRYYARGEFSQLENFELWCRNAEIASKIDEASQAKLARMINFVTSAELSARDIGQRNAETILSVHRDGRSEGQGLTVTFQHPYLIEFSSGEESAEIFFREVLFRDGFMMAAAHPKDAIALRLDGAAIDSGLEGWRECLTALLAD